MRGFARFLDASWNAALAAAGALDGVESTDFMADWAQANWEILVETAFRESVGFGKAYLEFYGEGADCSEASSCVWSPRAIPTHRILCQTLKSAVMLDLLTGRLVDASEGPVVFDRFAVKSERGWYKEAPRSTVYWDIKAIERFSFR